MALRNFGPADNPQLYITWMRFDTHFDKFFMSMVNIAPVTEDLTDEQIPTMIYLAWWGRSLYLRPNQPVDRTDVLVASWADFMGPKILESECMTQDQARTALVQAVKTLIGPRVVKTFGTATSQSYDAADEANTADEWDHVLASNGDKNTPHSAMKILKHLAATATPAFLQGGFSMILHVYLSILKVGRNPEPVVEKIQDELKNHLKISNFKTEQASCAKFFSTFRFKITENSMRDVTNRLNSILPETAHDLKSTMISLAAGGGLTFLITIGRAIRIFHDFNWCTVARMFPVEWGNVIAAMTAVGNNPWYGFRKDLGVVTRTNYKNVAYVAKELLINVNGEDLLRSYNGWTRQPVCKPRIDSLVSLYKNAKTNNMGGGDMSDNPENQAIERLREMIIRNSDVYIP